MSPEKRGNRPEVFMPQVVLKNTRRQMFHATMYHHIVCHRQKKCCCAISRKVSPNGKSVSVKQPKGFHVFALKESEPLEMAVLHLPQVKAAINSGWLQKMEAKGGASKKKAEMPAPSESAEALQEASKNKKGGK